MIEIPLNADVECTDGLCGQSTCVIVDPKTLQVTHFVVKEKKSPRTERLVHVDQVVETKPNLIRLSCTEKELAEMDPFVEKKYRQIEIPRHVGVETVSPYYYSEIVTLPVEEERIPPGELAVRQGVEVKATDGKVGQVDELLVDSTTGQITHFVIRAGHLWGQKDVIMPISLVDYADREAVYLTLDKQTISAMLAIPAPWRHHVTNVELIVLILKEASQAKEALQTLKQLAKKGVVAGEVRRVAPLNIALLVKDEAGQTSIKETEDVDPRQGMLFGAITGGLIGLLGGPVGAIVGATAGAATGRAAAKRIDMGFPDEYLEKLQENLQPGSAALVTLVQKEWGEKVTEALAEFEGELLRQALTDDLVAQFTTEADEETSAE